MFNRRTETTRTDASVYAARGGASAGPIITGVLVALGAMFLLSAIVGGILAALGYLDGNITEGEAIEMGIGAGVALVVAQLLAYMWGGYTAGRMGRGAGLANGLLVPLVAILLAAAIGGITAALGANANLSLPFQDTRLPLEENYLLDWGVGIGIASLVAMFLGGAIGGIAGARWHSKLENQVLEDRVHGEHPVGEREHRSISDSTSETHPTSRDREVDVRDDVRTEEQVAHDGNGSRTRTFRS